MIPYIQKHLRFQLFLIVVVFCNSFIFSQTEPEDVIHSTTISQNIKAPIRLAVDNWNNIYVSDAASNSIEKFDASGNHLETFAFSGSPVSVAVNGDNQIFVGNEDGSIMKIETDGSIFTFYTEDIYPSAMDFNTAGDLYIVDSRKNRVLVLNAEGKQILSFGVGILISPTSIAIDSRNQRLFVGEHGGQEGGYFGDAPCDVKVFDLDGNHTGTFGSGGSGDGEFYRIQGIDVGKCGNLYINDPFQSSISVYDENLNYVTRFGVFGDSLSQLNLPMDVIFDHEERILVSSTNNSRIEVFDVLTTLPTSNIQFSDASICGDETTDVLFDFKGTAPWTFTYTIDGLDPVDVTTGEHLYVLPVSKGGIYEVTALSDADNMGTCFTGSADVKVTEVPTSTISSTADKICEGEEVNVEIAFTGNAPWEFTYTKDGLNPETISTAYPNYILPVNETGLYEISKLVSKSCEGKSLTGSANVIVNPIPVSLFSEGHRTLDIYQGDTISLHANFTGTAPWKFTYTINDLNPVEVTTSNSLHVIDAFESGVYEVKEITDANCYNGWTDTYPEVIVHDRPTAAIANMDSTYCQGSHIQIPVTFTGAPPFSITYSYNDASIITYSDIYYHSFDISAYQTGNYKLVSVFDKYSDAMDLSGQADITVNPLPDASFSFSDSRLDVRFENSSEFADSYLWDFGDGHTSTELNPVHTYLTSGKYNVSLTAINFCGENTTSETVEVNLVSIDENSLTENFNIYPNPSDGKIFLEEDIFTEEDTWLIVIDLNGKIVKKESLMNKTKSTFIDLSDLSNGFYFVKLIENSKTRTTKLIIQR